MVTYWLNYPHKKSWQGTHTQYSCSNGLLEKDCPPPSLKKTEQWHSRSTIAISSSWLRGRKKTNICIRQLLDWQDFLSFNMLFGNIWCISYYFSPSFSRLLLLPFPMTISRSTPPLWRRARPQSTPAPRQRQRKCSAGGSNTVVHAWPWCVGVKRRDEKSCCNTKI